MMDLAKKSHDRAAQSYYTRISEPRMSLQRRTQLLDLANQEEMRENFRLAEELRRVAVGLPPFVGKSPFYC